MNITDINAANVTGIVIISSRETRIKASESIIITLMVSLIWTFVKNMPSAIHITAPMRIPAIMDIGIFTNFITEI